MIYGKTWLIDFGISNGSHLSRTHTTQYARQADRVRDILLSPHHFMAMSSWEGIKPSSPKAARIYLVGAKEIAWR